MKRTTRLTLDEVRVYAKELYILLLKACKMSITSSIAAEGVLNSVRRKYAIEKYMRVS